MVVSGLDVPLDLTGITVDYVTAGDYRLADSADAIQSNDSSKSEDTLNFLNIDKFLCEMQGTHSPSQNVLQENVNARILIIIIHIHIHLDEAVEYIHPHGILVENNPIEWGAKRKVGDLVGLCNIFLYEVNLAEHTF